MTIRKIRRRGWKLAFVFLVALVALAVAGFAYSAGGSNGQLVSQDRAYGGGQFTVSGADVRNFAIDAHANDSAAFGDIEYGGGLHAQHERVTCLNVKGNSATVGAIVTAADRPSAIGLAAIWVVQDNGGLLSATPDAATLQSFGPVGPEGGWPAGFPYVCPSPDTASSLFGLSFMPLTAGDIVVQDGPGQNGQ